MATLNLDYSSSNGFLFDTSGIAFTGALAQLANNIPSNNYYIASFHSSLNGDYSREGGSLTNTIVSGSPSIISGKADFNTGSAIKFSIPVRFNFPAGLKLTIKFKYTSEYTGNPSQDQEILNAAYNPSDDTNLVRIQHTSGGTLNFMFKGLSGSFKTVTHSWSPVSGTEYEFCYAVDCVNGLYSAWINRVAHGTPQTGAQDRRYWLGFFYLGETYVDTLHVPQFQIRDMILYDDYVDPSGDSAGYAVPTNYSTSVKSVQSNSAQLASAWTAFTTTQSASGSDTITHSPIINGVRKYWNGSAWVTASAGQSNTVAEINANCSSLIAASTDATIDLISYLTSADGSTTPTLTSATITYTAAVGYGIFPTVGNVRSGTVYNYGASIGTMSNVTNMMETNSLDAIGPLTADLEEVS